MAKVRPKGRNMLIRTKAGPQQPKLVQLLKATVHRDSRSFVPAPALLREHSRDLKSVRFEDFEQWNPIDACQLHGD